MDDLAEAAVFCLEQWQPAAEEIPFLNVGTGEDLPIRELAALVALGWRARIPLAERLVGFPRFCGQRDVKALAPPVGVPAAWLDSHW